MKKIMILMLSLAVLFSFAACDNNASNPAPEPDNPVDTTVDETTSKDIAAALKNIVGGDVEPTLQVVNGAEVKAFNTLGVSVGIDDLLSAENGKTVAKGIFAAYEDDDTVTITADTPETIVITKKIASGIDGVTSPSTVTLTVYGTDVTGNEGSTRNIQLEKFKYDVSIQTTSTLSYDSGNFAMLNGSVSGYLLGTAVATLDDAGKVKEFTVNSGASSSYINLQPILSNDPASVSATLGEAKAEKLFAFMNATKTAVSTYEDYEDSVIGPITNDINDVVEILIGANASGTSLTSAFATAQLSDASIKTKSFDSTGSGHAQIVYAVNTEMVVAADAASSPATSLATKTFTLDLYGKDGVDSGATSFAVDNFTLKGTFTVGGSTSRAYDEIVVDIAGRATGTISSSSQNANQVSDVSSNFAFTDGTAIKLTSGSVTIEDQPVGPEMENGTSANSRVLVKKPVAVEYPYTDYTAN